MQNKLDNGIKMQGIVSYVLTDKDGNTKKEFTKHNQIQNLGFAGIASRIHGVGVDAFTSMAIGTGNGQAITDTGLETEITTNGGARRTGGDVTITTEETNVANDTTQFVTTWEFTGGLTITEAGIFNAHPTGGTMLAYQDFGAINVANGDKLEVKWQIVFA